MILVLFIVWGTGSHAPHVTQNDLELIILLPLHPAYATLSGLYGAGV